MYLALLRTAFQRQLAYRTANLAGLATNIFFGALRAYVIIALFNARRLETVAGYSLPMAITYTGVTQALMSFLALIVWWDLIRSIRSGEVASDLSRPCDFFWYWCAQDAGRAFGQLLLRGLPIMILYTLVYRITLPPTLWHWLALGVSMGLGLLVSFSWRFLVSLPAFWLQDAAGVARLGWPLMSLLSGFLMPIAFFPPWAVTLIHWTPFPSMVSTPVEIYLGLVNGPALLGVLAVQALWVLILYGLSQLVLNAGVKKLVIQGG
jgi:ABC-2 type transport system permease protein